MALVILFYQRADDIPVQLDELSDAIAAQDDITWLRETGDDYRPFTWQHPATGTRIEGDLGIIPLEEDEEHPAKDYDGWREVPLSLHIPYLVPHWQCIDTLDFIASIMKRLPQLAVLNTEDTARGPDSDEEGPGPILRQHLGATWEGGRSVHVEAQGHIPHMERLSSLRLWRYRQEQVTGAQNYREIFWPQALVLLDGERACSAAIWPQEHKDFALPPVEYIVVQRGDEAGVIPADELVTAARRGEALPYGEATLIHQNEQTMSLFHGSKLLPVDRFKALGNDDWVD